MTNTAAATKTTTSGRIINGRLTFPASSDRYGCSYCTAEATHVGAGEDGDFYCSQHTHKAPGRVNDIHA